jgi:hypothetical protein
MVKDSPGQGSRSFIHGSFIRVRRTVFGTTAAANERELYGCRRFCLILPPNLGFGRLAGLGTSCWRGSLSAEGVKSSVQLPPKDAPLAPVGPCLSIALLGTDDALVDF